MRDLIRKILKEEINSSLGTFYLVVSEDENFIYGQGKRASKDFYPIEDYTPNSIVSSGYSSYKEAQKIIDWINYYKGGTDTPGKIATEQDKYKPKIVSVDFILKKRDMEFPI